MKNHLAVKNNQEKSALHLEVKIGILLIIVIIYKKKYVRHK